MCFLCQELIEQSKKKLESWDLNLAQIEAEPNLALLICMNFDYIYLSIYLSICIGFIFACQELII